MSTQFLFRWIVLTCGICGLLFYVSHFRYTSSANTTKENNPKTPQQITTTTTTAKTVAKAATAQDIILDNDLRDQIKLRKISTDQEGNFLLGISDEVKTLLFWTMFFGAPDARGKLGKRLFEGCPVSQCATTNDKGLLDTSDAVIFHMIDLDPNHLPRKRTANQHYIFFIGESPANVNLKRAPEGFFDMTYTYRLDSDIIGHYWYNVPLEESEKNFAEGKTKLAAWFVTNCKAHNKREEFVKKLQEFIPVDIYGGCGPLKCPRQNENDCFDLLRTTYKFYLAFENSICTDYVTEKFTNALHSNVVPIVLNGANMTIFPKNSYINVDDFKSAKELADYLKYLDKNDTAYNEYMKWRYDPEQIHSHGAFSVTRTGWCQLCEKLHDPTYQTREYPDAIEWYTKGHCKARTW